MKEKINFQRISSILTNKEMKGVYGRSGYDGSGYIYGSGSGFSGMCTIVCGSDPNEYHGVPHGDCDYDGERICGATSSFVCINC